MDETFGTEVANDISIHPRAMHFRQHPHALKYLLTTVQSKQSSPPHL